MAPRLAEREFMVKGAVLLTLVLSGCASTVVPRDAESDDPASVLDARGNDAASVLDALGDDTRDPPPDASPRDAGGDDVGEGDACVDCVTSSEVSASVGGGCARLVDRTIRCWGNNETGTIGDGSSVPHWWADTGPDLSMVDTVVRGPRHACALIGGAIRCWGRNDSGQLGDGTSLSRTAPSRVVSDQRFVSLSLGFSHSCALSDSGRVFCWGANDLGQLGLSRATLVSSFPVEVPLPTPVVEVSSGYTHTCAISTAGTWCWGWNGEGELGDGTRETRERPIVVPTDQRFVHVAVGQTAACGVVTSGELYCWGWNRFSQIPVPDRASSVPVRIDGVGPVQLLAVGGTHTCATAGEQMFCWGSNDDGQLGDGTTASRATPTIVPAVSNVRQISLGASHSCVRLRDARIRCWGHGSLGELGDGNHSSSLTPVDVRFE